MRWLPRLPLASKFWRLPLSDRSALALEAALLAPTWEARSHQIELLLAEDAALTLWAVCQAEVLDQATPTHCRGVGQWLATHLVRRFDWSRDQESPPDDIDSSIAEPLAERVARGVVVAEVARELAERDHSSLADEAHLLGLLHNAAEWFEGADWFEASSRGHGESTQNTADRPQGLIHLLQSLTGPSAPASYVHQALASRSIRSDQRDGHLTPLAERVRTVADHWSSSEPGIGWRLSALIAKLKIVEQTEDEFRATVEAEKLEAMKELAYGASHEINNPLANISARAQMLVKDETDPERRRMLAAINSQSFRAHEMIADLMLFARPPALTPVPTDLVPLMDRLIAELAPEAAAQETTILRCGPDLPVIVTADEVQLAVALRAMCVNALESLSKGGGVRLEARTISTREGEVPQAQIRVSDDGPGILPEIRSHLFDPFYSGREAGRGLGFGLSKSWRIVTDHGGRIEVESPQSGGAVFSIYLPLAVDSAGADNVVQANQVA